MKTLFFDKDDDITLILQYVAFGATLLAEAVSFQSDFEASLGLSVTYLNSEPYFIPPIAQLGFAPFGTMIESTVAEYSNFRYYSEVHFIVYFKGLLYS